MGFSILTIHLNALTFSITNEKNHFQIVLYFSHTFNGFKLFKGTRKNQKWLRSVVRICTEQSVWFMVQSILLQQLNLDNTSQILSCEINFEKSCDQVIEITVVQSKISHFIQK